MSVVGEAADEERDPRLDDLGASFALCCRRRSFGRLEQLVVGHHEELLHVEGQNVLQEWCILYCVRSSVVNCRGPYLYDVRTEGEEGG